MTSHSIIHNDGLGKWFAVSLELLPLSDYHTFLTHGRAVHGVYRQCRQCVFEHQTDRQTVVMMPWGMGDVDSCCSLKKSSSIISASLCACGFFHIGCFLKRFSINEKKKCKKKVR